jgi:hypothetical protein
MGITIVLLWKEFEAKTGKSAALKWHPEWAVFAAFSLDLTLTSPERGLA